MVSYNFPLQIIKLNLPFMFSVTFAQPRNTFLKHFKYWTFLNVERIFKYNEFIN